MQFWLKISEGAKLLFDRLFPTLTALYGKDNRRAPLSPSPHSLAWAGPKGVRQRLMKVFAETNLALQLRVWAEPGGSLVRGGLPHAGSATPAKLMWGETRVSVFPRLAGGLLAVGQRCLAAPTGGGLCWIWIRWGVEFGNFGIHPLFASAHQTGARPRHQKI